MDCYKYTIASRCFLFNIAVESETSCVLMKSKHNAFMEAR